MKSRELVVPLDKIASAGAPVQLTMRAADLETLPLFRGEHLRAFFLIGGTGWAGATLPFVRKSPAASGTSAHVEDKDSVREAPEPEIARGMPVYDSLGHVGVMWSPSASTRPRRTSRGLWCAAVICLHGKPPFQPVIQSVTDRITLNVPAQSLRRLEPAEA